MSSDLGGDPPCWAHQFDDNDSSPNPAALADASVPDRSSAVTWSRWWHGAIAGMIVAAPAGGDRGRRPGHAVRARGRSAARRAFPVAWSGCSASSPSRATCCVR
ncbi:MAG: hypothetical protein R2695_19760 [Acidimicrobiales bacterium]